MPSGLLKLGEAVEAVPTGLSDVDTRSETERLAMDAVMAAEKALASSHRT